jgi:hypothetical protein
MLNFSWPFAGLTLSDDGMTLRLAGRVHSVRFERAMRTRFPQNKNEEIRRIVEIYGLTGRTWFVFEPWDPTGGKLLAIQASAASLTREEPSRRQLRSDRHSLFRPGLLHRCCTVAALTERSRDAGGPIRIRSWLRVRDSNPEPCG